MIFTLNLLPLQRVSDETLYRIALFACGSYGTDYSVHYVGSGGCE